MMIVMSVYFTAALLTGKGWIFLFLFNKLVLLSVQSTLN